MGHGGVRVLHRSRGTGANRTQPSWPQVDRYQQRLRRSSTLPHAFWCVRKCATKGSNRSSRQPLRWKLYESDSVLCVRKTFFELKISLRISIADVSRARFCADAVRDENVRLPVEDPKAKQPGVCVWEIAKDDVRIPAAQRWKEHYAQVLETAGFSRGVASPCHFFY